MIRILLTALLLALPCSVLAELPVQLEKDFAPLAGYVVMPTGDNDYLIDLDAGKGVHSGDIFSIIRAGEKIIHPISGEVIGTLDGSAAYLEVTRIKSGYSYVRKISGSLEIKKGDRIQRFDSVPALFSDKTQDNLGLKSELLSKLGRLDWLSQQSDIPPLLIFERKPTRLLVKNNEGTALFSYPMAEKTPVISTPGPKALVPSAVAVASKPPVVATSPSGIIQNSSDRSNIWHGAEHKDEVFSLRIDDFNNDGQLETALLLKESLTISSYSGKARTVISVLTLKGSLSLLALDSLDLNGNGKPEIFLSAVKNGVPASRIYELEGNKLTEIARDLPMLFRRIEQPQQGPMLLGQKRNDLTVPFSGEAFQVLFAEGVYKQGPVYPLPATVNIYGFIPFTDKNGALHYAHLNRSGFLNIKTADGENLFESPDRYGGSEIKLTLQAETSKDLAVPFFLPQRVLFLNNEILATQNDGQRMTQNWRRYTKSRLVSLKWNGLSLDESWRTSDQSGQTADFAVADIDNDGQTELVLAVKFAHKGLFSSPKSAIVVYEMN